MSDGTEASAEKLIDADDAVAVVGGDEDSADDDACQQVAEHELDIGEVAQGVAFARGAEEGAGADFGCQDGGENGPPSDLAISKSEALHGATFAALGEAYAQDEGEVGEDDDGIKEIRHSSL